MNQITAAEYKLLDSLDRVVGNTVPKSFLHRSTRAMASRMRIKGLLRKRDWNHGWVRATQFGWRHWARYKNGQRK